MLTNDLASPSTGKRPVSAFRLQLQISVAVGAVVPLAAGAWGALGGLASADGEFVSHERYLSGLLLMIGIAFWSTIPGIERKTVVFRLLTVLVFGGGLCRLLGLVLGDSLQWPVAGALAMELVVTPLLCLWQGSLAARCQLVAVSRNPVAVISVGAGYANGS
jgi:hypothetical protein